MKLAILWPFLRTALISALCVGFVSQTPSPPPTVSPSCLVAQEDPHEGQLEQCTNARTEGKPHFCECKKDAEACDREDKKCIVTKTIVTVSTRGVTHDSVRHRREPSCLGQAPQPMGTRVWAEFSILPRLGALLMRTGSMP